MEIHQIASIELDRSRAFNHEILFRDSTGYILDRTSVKESTGWEEFKVVYEAWVQHEEFNGKTKGDRRIMLV